MCAACQAAEDPIRLQRLLQRRAFFTAHLAGALAAAGQPDNAATTALSALQLAANPGFGQALGELRRTAFELRPYARRSAVRELRHALTALPT
ncbi:hypothetical protein [Streptomyces sp. NPDC000410]|uniref:hypothetical protein n=1 Tax=Streptomyces sp. NPDC000410 TaxID=3154254 RepID=UPI003329D9D8